MDKFIYTFDVDTKVKLEQMGFSLLREDVVRSLYIFENNNIVCFDKNNTEDLKFATSNVLTF
mgnify:CR=1 FL=1